ncbi:hypothetical protein [Microbulbifer sp. SA54]|uniref:hypothetical protein n=1 Tax=Microbulbifer sp. SA54 TaxID=3401577 RepID=UPI003AB0DC34
MPAAGAWAAAQYCPDPNVQVTLNTGYCELCGGGQIQLTISNNTGWDAVNLPAQSQTLDSGDRGFDDVTVVVDIQQVATVYGTSGHSAGFAGQSGSQLTWNLGDIGRTGSRTISFNLDERDFDQEKLVAISRAISTRVEFDYGNCQGGEFRTRTGGWGSPNWQTYSYGGAPYAEGPFFNNFTLAIEEPRPGIAKAGRNVDAGMPRGTFSNDPDLAGNTIFGHEDDGIIWRVTIDNYNGAEPMYDVIFDDSMAPTVNMDVLAVCRSEADAESVAQGGAPSAGSCTAISGDELNGRHLQDDFGFPLPIQPGDEREIFIAGTLRNSCVDQVNVADNVQWGCLALNRITKVDGEAGITQSIEGGFPRYGAVNQSSLEVSSTPSLVPGLGGTGDFSNTSELNYDVTFTGLNANEPVGMRGLVTITIENRTGGTVNQVELTNTLPDEYILDPNFEPQFTISSFADNYNNYAGRVAGIDWRNRVTPSADQTTYLNNPALKAPNFYLSSVGNPLGETANGVAEQEDLLRHGDVATITFRIVQVNQNGSLTYYDRMADLDENDESLSPGTLDPQTMGPLTNSLRVQWGDFCDSNGNGSVRSDEVVTQQFTPNPENLNVDIPEPLYIIRDTGPTAVSVDFRNSGGHTASDYLLYVTFGNGLAVSPPSSCSITSNPPQHPDGTGQVPLWNTPPSDGSTDHNADGNPLPQGASVFRCDLGAVAPLQEHELIFAVEKNHGATYDDITMRADVVGEVRLADNNDRNNPQGVGEALVYPTPANLNDPIAGTTPSQQLANNYTLDAVRARALGFNLLKRYVPGSCVEAGNRVSGDGNGRDMPPQILVGEDCEFEIFAGGWFGFKTPGWDITVDSIQVADATPDHAGGDDSNTGRQGFISETRQACNSSGLNALSPNSQCDQIIAPVSFTPGAQLSEESLIWDFGGTQVTERNYWFLAGMTSRLLNNAVDQVAGPNQHSNLSVDYGRTSFRVTYESEKQVAGVPEIIFDETVANDGSGGQAACFKQGNDWNPLATNQCNSTYPGYPQWPDWTAQLQITEPKLHIVKEVCNFSRAGENLGACVWEDLEVEGSKFDDFVYRLTVTNEQESGPVAAPAYDTVITDILQSPQMCVWPFAEDGLNNTPEGDNGLVGINNVGADDYQYDPSNPDADIHCRLNGDPAHITFSYESSAALQQINSGDSVQLYYRVTPHRTVVPNQTFANTAAIFRYDSLSALAGNQNDQRIENINQPDATGVVPDRGAPQDQWIGGARIYCANEDTTGHCGTDDATMRIVSVDAEPKAVVEVSTTATGTPTQPGVSPSTPVIGPDDRVNVVVGEEVRFRLIGTVPAAELRNLTFRDELPEGLRCVEVDAVDLRDLDPDATWNPGAGDGATTPKNGTTCDENVVEWRYGSQFLTDYDPSKYPQYDGLFPIELTFVARVENSDVTFHGATLTNPGGVAQMTYEDQNGVQQEPAVFDPISLNVLGPRITLTKEFTVERVDADDVITVNVTATNADNEDGATSAIAYNLKVLDDLRNTKYRYVEGSEEGPASLEVAYLDGDTNAPVFQFRDDTETDRHASPYAIGVGESVSFSFKVRVVGEGDSGVDVAAHEVLANTIEARWQSLPHNTIALNATGTIGTDGAIDGMRIGELANTGNATNDYEISAQDSTEVGGLDLLKEDVTESGDTAESRAIGAHRTFRLDITLPEGVTENVVVTDTLSPGYVIANPAHGYEVRCEYDDTILAINDQAPDAGCEAFLGALPQSGDTGTITWDIGKVATHTEDDTSDAATSAIDPVIHIYYVARVENVASIAAGTQLSNTAELTYLNAAATETAAVGPIAVAEPVLTVTKTASATSAVSGDTLDYTVVITNASGSDVSTAYDVNIADRLPEQLRLDNATINGIDAMPGTRSSDGAFVWGRENGDNSLDIAPGETLTLVYNTTVMSAFDGIIENTVYVDWTSLDHGVPGQDTYPGDYQRHGENCPDTVVPNEYCVWINETVDTQDNTDFTKTAISDAWGAADRARIGDTVQYTLNLGLQPGITRNVVVTDQLPEGLQLVSVDNIDCGVKGFTCSQSPADLPAGTTGTLQWQFGDISAESDSTPPFTIVYTAVVLDDETVFPAGSGEIERINGAELTYDGAAEILQNQASIWVVQPNITDLVKSDTRSGVTSPYTVVDIANEVMNFRLEALNTGGAPAYGVVVTDTLNVDPANPEFDESTINIVQVQVAGQPANYEVAINGGIIEFTLTDPVPENAAVLIDYQVGLNTAIPSGHTWYNRFHIDRYNSSDIDAAPDREYLGTAPDCATSAVDNCFTLMTPVANPEDLTLQLLTPVDGRAPIGEPVSYRITVPASPIATSALADVVVENVVQGRDTAIVLDAVTVDGNPVTVADGETFTIDVGDIPPNEVREILVTGWVANDIAAQAGQTYDISATYTYSEAGVVTEMGGESAAITIVEPELALTQSAVNQSGNPEPVAGDIYRFSLALAEQGANGSTAYDLTVLEELSTGWAYEPGSALFNGVAIADPAITGDGINTAQTLAWNAVANTDIPVGETRTLEFDVRVLDSVLAGQELTGATSAQWTSQAGAPVQVERDGSGMPDPAALNNYFLGPQQLPALAIGNNATLAKNVLAETAPLNNGELRIGDLVTYELRLGVQRGTLPNAVVTDTLPAGMVFVDTVSIAADGMTYDLTQEPVAEVSGQVSWNLGSLVNSTGDELVITYRTRVQKDVLPLNAANTPLRNEASFQFDTATGPSTPLLAEQTLNLLQPDLTFALVATPDGSAALTPAQTITFTATMTNTGTAPAYDIVLRDVIPAGMRQGGVQTVSINGSTANLVQPSFDSATGDAIWNFANEIPVGGTFEVVYQVVTDSDIGAGLQISNNAYLEWYYSFAESDIPEGAVLENRQPYGPSDAVSVQFNTPDAQPLQIAVEPTTRDKASIGEPFVYRLTIPAVGTLNDVAIQMDLADSGIDPVDLAFVSAAQVSGNIAFNPQGSVAGTVLTIEGTGNGIDIEAGDAAVIDVTLRLRDTALNQFGKSFTARAGYSYSYANDDPNAGRGMGEVSEYSAAIQIVEPYELVLTKTGDAQIQAGLPARFLLDVHNRGTGPAWDLTVRDFLPNTAQGGMCETAPANFAATIVDGAGNTVATLSQGSDFTTAFDADACTLTFTTVGAAAAIAADHHVQFGYDAYLDADTVDGATLDNVAGAERWYSWDSTGPDARIYERTYASDPADGTPGIEDHEDVFTITAAVPSVVFEKVVANITSGDSPATVATPGDVLQYTLTLRNLSDLDVENIAITDELDRLNSPAHFAAGTLQLITAPAGSDSSATSASGGANGSGLLDVRNLVLGAAGSGGEEIQLVYQVQLVNVIDSGAAVLNQAQVQLPGQALIDSDDPNINGSADPLTAGDEDPTQVLIESAALLKVEKTSDDLTGEPDSLMPGDTLRYTLRVENIGNENVIEASLRDQVPANTTYVAGSTTLNGAAVDDVNGSTALADTLVIQSPGAEAGELLADPAASGSQAAIITFDVTINDVNDGTVISNQGFVNGNGAGGANTPLDEKPSDDPATQVADDPTLDIVGNVPLLRVQKTVALAVDNLTAGIVDPEDVLRYTITVTNMGGKDASEARLVDLVPEHTTYVAGSTTLNGEAVADNGSESPLIAGIAISSDDLTPPLPAAGEGVITTAQTATIVFDVMVNADTERGTVISNQGNVYSLELPLTLTDADGNSSNGAQPTEVVVGDAQQLSITKEVAVVGGGAAEAGKVLEYLVRVTNISAVPASLVSIYDDLLVAGEGVLTYVDDSARLNGQPTGVMVNGSVISADYSTNYGDLQPSETITLRFQARLAENLAIGYTVVNTAEVKWNDPPAYNEATVTIDIGGTPGIANVSGYLWHDVNFSETADSEERLLTNWTVELYFNNALLETGQSDENGYFQFAGLVPNMDGAGANGASYELRYSAPDAVDSTASLGNTSSDFTNGPQQIRDIYIGSGANPQNLNLPITPNGAIYDSVMRQPIAGARVRMLRASSGQPLPDACFDDPKQQNQITLPGGYYKFDVNFSRAECAVNADYLLEVDVPSADYVSGPSQIIPPQTGADTGSFDVAACLGSAADVIPATANHCEIQLSELPPVIDVDARGDETHYYLRINLDDSNQPGSSQLFNNHIALDPQLEGALALTKTAAMTNVTRSQLVPYTITFTNTLPVPLTDLQLVDYFPAGFKYVAGSANLDGAPVEPEVNGLQLQWPHLRAEGEQTHTLKLLLVVGSGVGEGEYINRARMFNELSGQQTSGEASATVRVVPDPTFDCTDVIGKVYDDKNLNGYQDSGEGGVPGARVVTANGLKATTDAHGRFHITCAAVPNPDRGSNFVLKLDDRSLPSGYRLTTENPRVQRATRGKMLEFNFGTSLHRVVRLDLAEAVFEPGTSELRPQWESRTELLLEKLQDAPSVLRLSYLAENEDPALVDARLAAIKAQIANEWAALDCCYPLNIETEIFWRRGAPPSRGGLLDGLKRSVDRALGNDRDQGGFQ